MRLSAFAFAATMLAATAIAQIDAAPISAPSYSERSILPRAAAKPVPLLPGMLVSIYGEYLGPSAACIGQVDARRIYPNELCGVRVLVGGRPAGLLCDSDTQINFEVPRDTPTEGSTTVQVIYGDRAGPAITMKLGLEPTAVTVEGEAFTDMPLWVKISLPPTAPEPVWYPSNVDDPSDFRCNEIEVRRNGQLLPRMALNTPIGGRIRRGDPCRSIAVESNAHPNALPVHLQYRFSEPGVYEIRYTQISLPFGSIEPRRVLLRSQWTRSRCAQPSPDSVRHG